MTDNSRHNGKTVSLVLGSGGARGLAHIGVIRWLEEHGYEIRSVAGCSMGALVGGVYAAGRLDEFFHWITAVRAIDMVSLLDVSLDGNGLVRGDKIIDALKMLIGDCLIEELDIRFTAVAADIQNEREVWLDHGPLFDAIRASISLPLFFTPVQDTRGTLIDGGVLNPVPIAPTFGDRTDLTIAVNLDGAQDLYEVVAPRERTEESGDPTNNLSYFEMKANEWIRKLLTKKAKPRRNADEWGYYDVVQKAFESMQGTIARQKLAAYPPDILIEIASNQCSILEFDRAEEMIEIGYKVTGAHLGGS
jgi:NTE family protein